MCSYGTCVGKNLAYWPVTLPLIVDYTHYQHTSEDDDAVLAALEHSGRVHRIEIVGTDSLLNKVANVMRKPFPSLSHLDIAWNLNGKLGPALGSVPIIPRKFLGHSASHLQHLYLSGISLPHLPAFLLSARNLVTLNLENIFQEGYAYLSPKALAEGLAILPSLTTLSIRFHDATSTTDQSRQDPPIILPSLTVFRCEGYSEYLEDLLARLITPRVDCVKIEYYVQDIRALRLSRFLDRTENLKLNQFMRARVLFFSEEFSVELDCPQGNAVKLSFLQQCIKDGETFQFRTLSRPTSLINLRQRSPMWIISPHMEIMSDWVMWTTMSGCHSSANFQLSNRYTYLGEWQRALFLRSNTLPTLSPICFQRFA